MWGQMYVVRRVVPKTPIRPRKRPLTCENIWGQYRGQFRGPASFGNGQIGHLNDCSIFRLAQSFSWLRLRSVQDDWTYRTPEQSDSP